MPLSATPEMDWNAFNNLPLSNPLQPALSRGYLPVGDKWYTPTEWANQISDWNTQLTNTEGGLMAWLQRNQTVVFAGAGALFLLAMFSGGRRR